MKHYVTLKEIQERTIVVETDIDDETKSKRRAKKIARGLYEDGEIDMTSGGMGIADIKIKVEESAEDLDKESLSDYGLYDEGGEVL